MLVATFSWALVLWQRDPDSARQPDLTRLDPLELRDSPDPAYAISVIEDRVARNPGSFIDYTVLGDMNLGQLRRSGDAGASVRAEEAFQKALEINPSYAPAIAGYASALFSQHRFDEAITWSQKVPAASKAGLRALATIADSQLSLGRYSEAESSYAELAAREPGPATDARLSHLRFLFGDADGALRLARSAATSAYVSGIDPETMAWYLSRVGELFFGQSDLNAASAHYRSALAIYPDHYPSLVGLARVTAATGDLDESAGYYVRAADISPQPAVLAALGDVYAALGRTREAETQFETVELIGRLAEINKSVYNRELALFYSDHDTKVVEALLLAGAEIEIRKDVNGYDALAWALYRNGRHAEALNAVGQALRLGTPDASFHYHAGLIYQALGRRAEAAAALELALRINPYFSLGHAGKARAALNVVTSDGTEFTAGVSAQ